jgi:hypothetical protein
LAERFAEEDSEAELVNGRCPELGEDLGEESEAAFRIDWRCAKKCISHRGVAPGDNVGRKKRRRRTLSSERLAMVRCDQERDDV